MVVSAEPIIKNNPHASVAYARYELGGRFPDGEAAIINSPEDAKNYAIHVLHYRWPAAEPRIKKDEEQWDSYKDYFGIEEQD